jgi:hypothetical protein
MLTSAFLFAQVIPPSPPVFGAFDSSNHKSHTFLFATHTPTHTCSRLSLGFTGYEVEVAAAAGSGMGLYLIFACLCCTVFGGRSMRARHHSRWPFSNQITRVDGAIPYTAEESRREGEFYDHLTKGQLPIRSEDLEITETASHAAFGTKFANMLFSLPAGNAPSASANTGGSFTFASLVGNGGGGGSAATSQSPRKLRL